jgi:mRNA-degrading endonuclease YafQ of YafQ-DinJ toxin-antitoxin module
MKRTFLKTNTFIRVARKMLQKKPFLAADVQETLKLLEDDAFHPYLKTHKLIGSLEGSLACSRV